MTTALTAKPTLTSQSAPPGLVEIGQWYWLADAKDGPWLGCVVAVGSNYAKVHAVGRHAGSVRIHLDEWEATCTPEPNAATIIAERVAGHQATVHRLLEQIRGVAARLALRPAGALPAATTDAVQAIAIRSPTQDPRAYERALVAAKKTELPELFDQVKRAHEELAAWMQATALPLEAQADELHSLTKAIDDRVLDIGLYAGLPEEVEQVADGAPAPLTEPIRLFQRRCYMDEECLAEYQTGGMDFKGIAAFDRWLVRPKNLRRLLPHPRCVVAFQVRRHDKEREAVNLSDFIRFRDMADADRTTFLYLRNGARVYRLSTAIDFGPALFPDLDRSQLDGPLWAEMFGSRVERLVSAGEYQAHLDMVAAQRRARAKAPKKERWHFQVDDHTQHEPFTPASVYYDDIGAAVAAQVAAHNRVVLILQGLLDRSAVFHPHPPWQLWDAASFAQALVLVYDSARALTAGEPPDFEAYRARCNASLRVGSMTVGQQDEWLKAEAVKESRRLDQDWRNRSNYRPTRFQPYDDPGPGEVAAVQAVRGGRCTYRWHKEPRRDRYGIKSMVPRVFTTAVTTVLNVDAYAPGDFHQFFDDPRSRADYLQWAPLLLRAEEYHAKNRKRNTADA